MSSEAEQRIFIGVDGGGSRCRVRVADPHGMCLAEAEGGAANVYLAFDDAIGTIRASIAAALASLPRSADREIRLGLGLAGASSPIVAAKVEAALRDIGSAIVTHDGDTACIGAYAGADGGLIIAGTGSSGVLRREGRMISLGGRGFLMGDDGSGARLGLAAWRRALRAHDGFEPHTDLSRALMAQHDDDPVAVIHWARKSGSNDFASIVPMVFSWAARRDAMALDLLAETAAALVEIGEALTRRGAPRLAMVGGMAQAIAPYLPPAFQASLQTPMADALDGALILAGCPACAILRRSAC